MTKKIYIIMFDNGEPFEDYICTPYSFEETEEDANSTVEKLNKELKEDRDAVLDIVHDGTDELYIDDPEKTKIVDDLETKYRVSMGLPYILSVDWFKRASFHCQTLEKKED